MTMKNHLLLNETVMWLATGWNTQSYLKLSDYQSAPPVLEDENKQTNKKRCVKLHILQKKTKQALSYFLASTWQNWIKRRRRRKGQAPPVPGLGRGKRLHTPSLSLPSPSCCRGRVWAWPTVTPIGHIWIFFFLTVFWPHPHTLCPSPPPTHSPSLSHGALISADQAFNLVMMEGSMLSYA